MVGLVWREAGTALQPPPAGTKLQTLTTHTNLIYFTIYIFMSIYLFTPVYIILSMQVIFHSCPAYLFDTVARLTNNKPYMVKLTQRMHKATRVCPANQTKSEQCQNQSGRRWHVVSQPPLLFSFQGDFQAKNPPPQKKIFTGGYILHLNTFQELKVFKTLLNL